MESTQVTMTVVNMSLPMWGIYFLAAIIGAVANSLVTNKGSLIWPHREYLPDELPGVEDKNKSRKQGSPVYEKARDMGFTGDILVGLAAATAILWTMTPQTFFQLIGIGAVAGYGGSTILQSLLNKVNADISETEKGKLEGEIELEKLKIELEKEKAELLKMQKKEVTEKQRDLKDSSTDQFVVEKLLEILPQ